ncbi:MAG: DNA polymerase IV [Candidatus Komeilibacteria bacterium]|nr:DNA polymerase IV [Candidatus Komeilibacteria bacterium]
MPFGAHSSFPHAILHIDGDAFFASCEQSLHPELKGKPVITGKERGIAASMSYEAKAMGVTRAMMLSEIKKICPDAIILPSDYETYSLLSKRFFEIVRRYTSDVEEYGIDECFADITGMRRPLHMSYPQIAEAIQKELLRELDFTFSVGLAPTKVLAKIASKWKKPYGLTVIRMREIMNFLGKLPVGHVWGIGPQTEALLAKFGVRTALQFAQRPEMWVHKNFSKPFYEIWHELNGRSVMPLALEERGFQYSVQKFKTFTPPSTDRQFVFAQLSKNIESACIKIRRYHQATRDVMFFLRTQQFESRGVEVRLSRPSAFAHDIVHALEQVFDRLYRPSVPYRQTGVVLCNLTEDTVRQPDLFGQSIQIEKMQKLYDSIDQLGRWYGKHTVFLGSSFAAQKFVQHLGDRGDVPVRRSELFKGESKRKRLNIPLFAPGRRI